MSSIQKTRAWLFLFALSALLGIGATCGEGGTSGPAKPQGKRSTYAQVHILGTGKHVWLQVVFDGHQEVHDDYKLPFRSDYAFYSVIKVEAKNGPRDYGSIECQIQDERGRVMAGGHDVAGGPSAHVLCIHHGAIAFASADISLKGV